MTGSVVGTAGLLLAAGAGRRFGRPKALVELDGASLLERGVGLLLEGGCAPVVVVLGADAETVRRLVPDRRDVVVAVAADWADGMGASLRAGLHALQTADAQACVVALVDQPLIGVEAVRRLRTADPGARHGAVVAGYEGRPRNPVLLRRAVWPEVAAAAVGDTGARAWLRDHPQQVLVVDCDDTGSAVDVDTPDDLARLTPPADDPTGVPA